jgi:hypothetical protein
MDVKPYFVCFLLDPLTLLLWVLAVALFPPFIGWQTRHFKNNIKKGDISEEALVT